MNKWKERKSREYFLLNWWLAQPEKCISEASTRFQMVRITFDSSYWVTQKGAQVLKFKPRCKLKQNLSVFRREILDQAFRSLIFLVFSVDSGKTLIKLLWALVLPFSVTFFPRWPSGLSYVSTLGKLAHSAVVKALPPLSSTRGEYGWGLSPLSVFLSLFQTPSRFSLASCFPE